MIAHRARVRLLADAHLPFLSACLCTLLCRDKPHWHECAAPYCAATNLLGGESVVTVVSVVSDGIPTNATTNIAPEANTPGANTPADTPADGGNALPSWGIAIIVVFAVLFALVCMLMIYIINKEKTGQPIFIKTVKPAA